MDNLLRNRAIGLLLLAFALVWFGNIEYRILIKPDEGRYAEIAREMALSGDWVTPRLNGLKYFEKPPLQYWATAAAYELFGEHHWTARLWTALTGFAGVLLVWFAGRRLFGREAGDYAAILLGSCMLYALMGHVNTLDMGVTFFITLGLLAFLLAQRETGKPQTYWMWLAWVALALAVLSKGLMGLVLPGAALVVYSAVQRDMAFWRRMRWFSGLSLLLLVTTPWFYLVIKANPEFFDKFFIYEHYTRFTTKELGRYQPWYYFIPLLLFGMLPWTVLMFDAVLDVWKRRPVRSFSPEIFLLVWSVFVFLFFSYSGSKLPSYILPMAPALALLMGQRLAAMENGRLFKQLLALLPVLVALLVASTMVTRDADTPLQRELYQQFSYWLIAAMLIWLAGMVTALVWLRRARKMSAVLVLAFATLITGQLGGSGYNTIAKERSGYYIAEQIKPLVRSDAPFYSVAMYEQTLPFYLKRTFTLVAYEDEMGFGIKQEPHGYIPTLEEFARIWARQQSASAIIPANIFPILQNMQLQMKIIYQDPQYVVVIKP